MHDHKKRYYLSPPHMDGTEIEYVKLAFETNWIAPLGPNLDAFEQEFCEKTGASYAAALSSGTAALHLALILLDVKPGDEVICSSFTFAGSANPIVYQGATPVFIDSEENSWNMDPALLEKAIKERIGKGKKPKAVIVVHLYGNSADLDSIVGICNKYEIPLIEDAAESLGSIYKGQYTGTVATMGIYSFNGNKIITTSGGGMFVSHDKSFVEKARFYSTQSRDPAPHYEHTHIGYNYRLSNISAGIGRGQLAALDKRVAGKREIFSKYQAAFSDISGISLIPEPDLCKSNRWLTCITLDPGKIRIDRERVRLGLERWNIESRPLWKPMHLQPVFRACPAYVNGVSEKLFDRGLCLPSGTAMCDEDVGFIIKKIRDLILK